MKIVEKIFLTFSDTVTSVKRSLAEKYKKTNKKSHFIPNGVGKNEFIDTVWADNFLNGLNLKKNDFLLFITGRFLPTKGPLVLLKAINELKFEMPTLFIGEQGYVPDYDKKFNSLLEKTPNAVLHTVVDTKAKVLGLMQRCKFLIFPSSVEAMSMVLLEAASVGTPILCSDIQENYEVMGDKAIYFHAGDVVDLKSKLIYANNHYDQIKLKAQEKRKMLHSVQSWEAVASMYEKLYKSMMAKGAA